MLRHRTHALFNIKIKMYNVYFTAFRWESGLTLSSQQLVKYHFSDISLVITFWLSRNVLAKPVRLLTVPRFFLSYCTCK